jgi:hypothetical protein
MTGGVRFSVVEWKEEGSKAIDWDEERHRAKRGCADRNERKRVKKKRKFEMEAERERIRGQVRQFLAYLADLDNQVMIDHLSARVVSDILRELIGTEALQVCIDTFRQRFITPGNDVDLADWPTVQRLQMIMTTFNLRGLYDDPVTAAAEGELTSDSDADQH